MKSAALNMQQGKSTSATSQKHSQGEYDGVRKGLGGGEGGGFRERKSLYYLHRCTAAEDVSVKYAVAGLHCSTQSKHACGWGEHHCPLTSH